MKHLLLAMAVGILLVGNLNAQVAERTKSQGVFVEVLGNGLIYSVNYDTRFSQRFDGIGGRAGIGYIAIDGTTLTTMPFLLNYLFGKEKHFFEIGVGPTVILASANSGGFGPVGDRERGSAVIGTMSVGYRLEPTDGGFMFRAGLTPIFDSSSFWPLWPQVSFGYAF
ncbi:MAG TPA: hypothetical protein VK921_08250 [Anditalea sp.]|nr:hypothetical protein [Anditalea sp.]